MAAIRLRPHSILLRAVEGSVSIAFKETQRRSRPEQHIDYTIPVHIQKPLLCCILIVSKIRIKIKDFCPHVVRVKNPLVNLYLVPCIPCIIKTHPIPGGSIKIHKLRTVSLLWPTIECEPLKHSRHSTNHGRERISQEKWHHNASHRVNELPGLTTNNQAQRCRADADPVCERSHTRRDFP